MSPVRRAAARLAILTAFGLVASCAHSGTADTTYDLLIVDGMVHDGTLDEPRVTNIAIRGGHIAALDVPATASARAVIDAEGMAVTPGFIDPHTHALADLRSRDARRNTNYLTQGVTTVFVGNDGSGVPNRRRTLASLAKNGVGTSVGFFAGHNRIRRAVLGRDDRAPSPEELEEMQDRVAAEMRAGALGLSTGLYYVPGSYAEFDEVLALARVAARHGGLYETHLRDESSYTVGLLAAVEEAIAVAREAAMPAHISHVKALGRDVWGRSRDVIASVDAANAAGLDVSANLYPWRASGTNMANALVPRWAMEGSKDAMRGRFRDARTRGRLMLAMHENLERRNGPDAILVTDAESRYRGLTLAEIASDLRLGPVAAARDLVLDDNPAIASFNMSRDDIDVFAREPWVMFGSDGTSGHPRKYASYPKAYRDFVVGGQSISFTEYVRKSSGLVADTFGLCNRGYIRKGLKADIAVIDLDRFVPKADYQSPERLSDGVRHLVVNGVAVIRDYRAGTALPGEVIRKNALACEAGRPG